MSGQLSLFGTTPDQSQYQSAEWGTLTFYPTGSKKWKDNCRHCLLWVHKKDQKPTDECCTAPCSKEDRADGQDGYFGIQNMPTERRPQ